MSYDDKIRIALKFDEGERHFVYNDKTGQRIRAESGGNLTVGVGRNIDANMFSNNEIELMLSNDIKRAEQVASAVFPEFSTFSENRAVAIVNLIFNIGASKFLEFHRFIAAVKVKSWIHAARELKDSLYYKQVPERAERLIRMLAEDKFPYGVK